MSKPKILLQLDADPQPSVFDAVTAIDSGVDHLLRHHSVSPENVRELVHGAMFTRGPADLKHTAIFVGGSNLSQGEALFKAIGDCFFGPMRVSVLLDSNGANTTAAAAVLAAARHVELSSSEALVLGGTGPVGARAARLIAAAGGKVRLASRNLARAEASCEQLGDHVDGGKLTPLQVVTEDDLIAALQGVQVVVAAGAAGVTLLPADVRKAAEQLRVAIDLNAVPPAGIEGVDVTLRGEQQEGVACYGAIGVGGAKMKIHKAAVRKLFEANDQRLDAEQIFAIGQSLDLM